MKLFRKKILQLCFLALTGITFLNMSFFLAEVAFLESAYGKDTIENIARMFCNSLSEEETDSAETPETLVKEIDFLEGYNYHLQFEQTDVSNILKIQRGLSYPHGGYSQIFTPPPDRG